MDVYDLLLEDLLAYYADIEDAIIHQKERQGEWEDPTYEKAKVLLEIEQKIHSL